MRKLSAWLIVVYLLIVKCWYKSHLFKTIEKVTAWQWKNIIYVFNSYAFWWNADYSRWMKLQSEKKIRSHYNWLSISVGSNPLRFWGLTTHRQQRHISDWKSRRRKSCRVGILLIYFTVHGRSAIRDLTHGLLYNCVEEVQNFFLHQSLLSFGCLCDVILLTKSNERRYRFLATTTEGQCSLLTGVSFRTFRIIHCFRPLFIFNIWPTNCLIFEFL